MNCQRVIPTVITTKNDRYIAAYHRQCGLESVGVATITPPTPDEPSFPVVLCKTHIDEADTWEPLPEDDKEFCTQCRTYMRKTDRGCEC